MRVSGGRQVEDALERVVQLFAFVIDKDRFGEIYRNHLAKRLLNGRSASADAERSMISKLKLRCGAQYTSKLEGMMSDLQVGLDQARDYRAWAAGAGLRVVETAPAEFAVQVLTTGWWPSFRDVKLTVPPVLRACQHVFETYYAARTSNRRLAWCFSLGSANVRANFSRPYDLAVATLQAACLLLFNDIADGRQMSIGEVQDALGIEEEVAKRVLHSLSCGKFKILTKTPPGRAIGAADRFAVNSAFTCAMRKVRIPMASLDESHNPQKVR